MKCLVSRGLPFRLWNNQKWFRMIVSMKRTLSFGVMSTKAATECCHTGTVRYFVCGPGPTLPIVRTVWLTGHQIQVDRASGWMRPYR